MTEAIDAFAERVFGSILGTFEVASIFLGDRLGLYRSLADDGPATSGELAARVGVAERYAREWLEQQAAIGYLTVDDVEAAPNARRYELPPAHAEVLADGDSTALPGGGGPDDRRLVRSDARAPGGLPDRRRRELVGVRRGHAARAGRHEPAALPGRARHRLASRGSTVCTRRSPHGGRVADIGCGTGWSSIAIALAYPAATVDGFDIDEASVEAARANAEASSASRTGFGSTPATRRRPRSATATTSRSRSSASTTCPRRPRSCRRCGGSWRAAATAVVVDEKVGERFTAPADDVDRLMYGYSLLICLPDGMSVPPGRSAPAR